MRKIYHQQKGFAFLVVLLFVLAGGAFIGITKVVLNEKKAAKLAGEDSLSVSSNLSNTEDDQKNSSNNSSEPSSQTDDSSDSTDESVDLSASANVASKRCVIAIFDGVDNLVTNTNDGEGNGTNRWCVTDSGNTVAGDVLSNKVVWVDGVAITGTMANNGQFNLPAGATDTAVTAGYYSGGTLTGDTDLIAGNIKAGVTIFGVGGDSSVVNTTSGTATAGQILSGAVAWVDGAEVTGTMNNNGLFALTATVADQAVTAGYYSGGTLSGDTDLTSANILSGTTIFGVAGNSNVVNTSTGTATAGDLLSGSIAWVDGSEVTGTLATQTLSAASETVSAGYYAATTLSAVDTDLTTGNILSGTTIFGISGNSNVVNTSTGDAIAADLLLGKVAWVDGASVTGSVPTNTLSAANDTVSAGYYAATTLSAVDTDLATANILSGKTIFGIAGNSNVVNTSTGDATTTDILFGKVAWVDGAEVTGTIATRTLDPANDTVATGYYNATTLSSVDTDLATGNILSGKTIFGVAGNSNVVNTSTGTATTGDLLSGLVAWVDGSEVTGTLATRTLDPANDIVSAGNYGATTLSAVDTDLATGNILSGKTIFGIAGNANVVNTSTGDAVAADLLFGKIAFVDGASVTGTISTNTLSTANDTVAAGYYNATTLSALDTDLATGNILSGKTIFGFAGNSNVVNTASGTATVGDLLLGLVAWVDGASVTGTIATRTLDPANDTVAAGYYNATTLSGVDADLVAGNIVSGVTIFGIPGSAVVGYTYGDASQTKVLTTATGIGTYNATNLSVGTVKSGTLFGVGLTGEYPSATYPLAGAGTVAGAADVASGKVAWSNDGSQISGIGNVTTLTSAGPCATQQYYDSHASATEGNNCSLTWTTNGTPATGDDNRSGRGGYDPRTGLTWSQYLKNTAGVVGFAASSGSTWSWDGQQRFTVTAANATAGATYTNNSQTFTVVTTIVGGTTLTTTPTGAPAASGTLTLATGTGDATITFSAIAGDTDNIAVGGKTAALLCSERGSGWRLPTEKELLQAYIDGAYWNLTQPSNNYWSMTESNSTSAYYVYLSDGNTNGNGKTAAYNVRCVR